MNEELLTAREAAAFLKLPSVRAFYAFRRRHRHAIPNVSHGRALRVRKVDLVISSRVFHRDVVDMRALARQHARGGADVQH